MLVCPGAASEFLYNWGPGITSYLEGREKAFVLKFYLSSKYTHFT